MPGLSVDLASVESNMINVDHHATGLSTAELLNLLKQDGVLASGRPPRHIRLVVNRHHDRSTINEAIGRLGQALQGASHKR